jgi:cysteine synthase A
MPSTSVLEAIGNTPLVQLRSVVPSGAARVFIKLEYYNPTGSYKDRMALSVIAGAERRGALRPGMRVVEYTGGSTGSSLALVCAVKGYRFTPISSDAFSREKLDTMRAFGGDLMMVPSDGGKITPALFARFREAVARETANPDVFWADQFHNRDVVEGYEPMGREILAQMDAPIHAFCAAVGSGGMLLGVSRALKAGKSGARIVALEPAESPLLSAGHAGAHRVEGVGVGFRPPHMQPGDYDEVRTVEEAAARAMARRLAREEGIFAGTSSGMNVHAAVELARELGPEAAVVTVAVDSGLKYLTGDLYAG